MMNNMAIKNRFLYVKIEIKPILDITDEQADFEFPDEYYNGTKEVVDHLREEMEAKVFGSFAVECMSISTEPFTS